MASTPDLTVVPRPLAATCCFALLAFALARGQDESVPRAVPVKPAPRAIPVAPKEEKIPVPRAIAVEPEAEEIEEIEAGEAAPTKLADWTGAEMDEAVEGSVSKKDPAAENGKDKPGKEIEPAEPDPELPPLREANTAGEDGGEKPASAISASWETRPEARTLTLKVPAPRGQITDRFGQPLAQNQVGYFLALKMPYLEGASDAEIVAWAEKRIRPAARYLGKEWSLSDEAILSHYKNRRWLPLPFSSMLSIGQKDVMEDRLQPGVVLFPTYQRLYPERSVACHIVGYVGKQDKMASGPVVSGEPMWPITEGREGLEDSFDKQLQGTPGTVNYLFDTDGARLSEDMIRRPRPGNNVVTTIDLEMQELAEDLLKNHTRRGAFVVMDVQTGDIYAMASLPTYDINTWIPAMSTERFKELQEDPGLPLFPRAFRGQYPPASTFKIPVALAALESGVVDGGTLVDCPPYLRVGNETFKNWNTKSEGKLNVVGAIKRSCNTWFYQVGRRTGAENLSSMAHRFGFGSQTGIPLRAEEDGFMPTEALVQERFGHAFNSGYVAQSAIGQWAVSATPLQVAQCMAGVANGYFVPKPRLVMQVQDMNNNIVESFEPVERNALNLTPKNLGYVRQGMVDVVNSSSGTGKRASNFYVTMAGKTGTGEWIQDGEKLYLSWFSGYLPAENPKYAFAAVCEGRPGEYITGGKKAAPLVGSFFNTVYKRKKERGEMDGYRREALASTGEGEFEEPSPSQAPEARPVSEGQPVTDLPRRRGIFGFGKRGRR